jgi:hypothetical protein
LDAIRDVKSPAPAAATLIRVDAIEILSIFVQDHLGEFSSSGWGDLPVAHHAGESEAEGETRVAGGEPGGLLPAEGGAIGITVRGEENFFRVELEPFAQPEGERACGDDDGLL